jgi:hypothetical protein
MRLLLVRVLVLLPLQALLHVLGAACGLWYRA